MTFILLRKKTESTFGNTASLCVTVSNSALTGQMQAPEISAKSILKPCHVWLNQEVCFFFSWITCAWRNENQISLHFQLSKGKGQRVTSRLYKPDPWRFDSSFSQECFTWGKFLYLPDLVDTSGNTDINVTLTQGILRIKMYTRHRG